MNFPRTSAPIAAAFQCALLGGLLTFGQLSAFAADSSPASPVVTAPAGPAGPIVPAAPGAAAAAPLPVIGAPASLPPSALRPESVEGDGKITISADSRHERARVIVEAGVRYENGEGVERDLTRALSLYCEAAKADLSDAFIRIGWLYANGRGVPRSDAIAGGMFHRAAKLGNDMGERLADLYLGQARRDPPCLGGEALADDAPPVPKLAASRLPTPVVEAPAQFKAAAPSIERKKVLETVLKFAKQLRLDPRLVMAVIGTESNFDPLARSVKNAQGLMQLIPDTAERFAVKDILDPIENLRGGMSYLRWLLAYYKGDVWLAVAAYNAGEGAVDKFRGIPPFAETIAYVQKIRNQYPLDWHPFDASAAGPSQMFNGRKPGPTTQAPAPLPSNLPPMVIPVGNRQMLRGG